MSISGFRSVAVLLLAVQTYAQSSSEAVSPSPRAPNEASKIAVETSKDRPDSLFDLPPIPRAKASLLGGTVESLDRVRDRLVLRSFGGGKVEIAFDPRTQFIRGETPVDVKDLHAGDRVHVETILNGTKVFAKKIHLGSSANIAQGEARGQVMAFDRTSGRMSINDEVSAQALQFQVSESTKIVGEGLGNGSLVEVAFRPGNGQPVAEEVRVLAVPGATFRFAGRVTYLDLLTNKMVVANTTDNKKYEITFNPAAVDVRTLHEGSSVSIDARFDGQRYAAQSIAVLTSRTREDQ